MEPDLKTFSSETPRSKAQTQQYSGGKPSQDASHKAAVNSAREEWQRRHQLRQEQASTDINSQPNLVEDNADSDKYIIKKGAQSPENKSSNRKNLREDLVNDSVKRKLKKLQIKEVFTNLYFE